MFPKILFLVIKSKIQTKLKKIGKKLRKSDYQMYNFMKQNYIEVERGIQHMNYQKEVAILTNFDKKTAKRSKNEEINRKKSQKLTKNQEICASFAFETQFQAMQNTVLSISGVYAST